MTAPIWLSKAWAWLKKYWQWLLFPVGILLYVIGRSSAKTNVTVVSPGLTEHEAVKDKLDTEAARQKQQADREAQRQLSDIEMQRRVAEDVETNRQVSEIKEAQGDPQAVNDLLKKVGKDIR